MAFQDAGTLSGGEKTKLALAQLVAGRHNLLLLDEPTNNLDPPSRQAIGHALSSLAGGDGPRQPRHRRSWPSWRPTGAADARRHPRRLERRPPRPGVDGVGAPASTAPSSTDRWTTWAGAAARRHRRPADPRGVRSPGPGRGDQARPDPGDRGRPGRRVGTAEPPGGAERPGDAVVGEEYGASDGAAGTDRRWIIDPIDGTKNFVRGIPVWATLIALEAGRGGRGGGGVGTGSRAALVGRTAPGCVDDGGHRRQTPAEPTRSTCQAIRRLGDAHLSYSSLTGWSAHGGPANLLDLAGRCWRSRAFGDFWSHLLVAEGACEIGLDPEVSLWDLAALQVIVEEAGGPVQRPFRCSPAPTGAAPSAPTACSTTGCWPSSLSDATGDARSGARLSPRRAPRDPRSFGSRAPRRRWLCLPARPPVPRGRGRPRWGPPWDQGHAAPTWRASARRRRRRGETLSELRARPRSTSASRCAGGRCSTARRCGPHRAPSPTRHRAARPGASHLRSPRRSHRRADRFRWRWQPRCRRPAGRPPRWAASDRAGGPRWSGRTRRRCGAGPGGDRGGPTATQAVCSMADSPPLPGRLRMASSGRSSSSGVATADAKRRDRDRRVTAASDGLI